MIDFTSSQEGADAQTRACCRLVAAIVVQAIRDAATPLSAKEKQTGHNLGHDPRQAVIFLFGPEQVLDAYCALIGVAAHQLRQALLSDRQTDVVGSRLFRAGLRPLRVRERFYRAEAERGLAPTPSPPRPQRSSGGRECD